MKINYFFFSFFLIVAGACAKKNQPTVTYVQENSVAGTALDIENTENVRYNETLKAYPIGRYIDPNNPDVMHEAHTIYRAETKPAWNLDPNMPTAVPMGPAIAVTLPDMQYIPLTAELENRIQEQNRLLKQTAEQNNRMLRNLQSIEQQKAKEQQNSAEAQSLQRELEAKQQIIEQMRQQVNTLESQNREMQGTYQSLERAQQGTKTNSSLIENLKKQLEFN